MTTTFDGPALRVDNVVKRFGPKTAVDGLSFVAQRGEVLALLGPNGAGKTTTIEMCEGFQVPTSGTISVLGLDPVTQGEQVRSRIGIMLQSGGSYNSITVRDMLNLAASYNKDPHDPEWVLQLLGLEGAKKTTYKRLSGGQKQRLSFALAMIGRPDIIFLDEPTAGMDAQSRLAIWDIINAMRNDGTTVILSTHLMDEAESLADQVIIVDHGQIVAEGTPEELTANSGAEHLTFETEAPLDISAASAAGVAVRSTRPLHYQLEHSATPDLIAAVAAESARQGVLIRNLGVRHRNLEEVFLDITGRELRS
ncbi:ABC transporter ATP-binding protein [Corynebacterium cystitidis]|uniref:ABC-2 type transport system ATP-binding protein n=1 Tax=Corynebacterium cystitidis DSM 20524 TaxID=1121357 RepID=A0A1H9PKS8_9CORY|nr:ABC transporter ATP-binding protein [Corynebacterium cystitidis]WJY82469.1 Daunorubicin/doxorubicin resistance ATP-binding protein DrrA [Corynebacterium cystitidis DSM 20524]SER48419.1 ABC-2 type transport system ATP-binding protein [Corynebacterium cystitidis DSM 20524]SNV75354.1 ABC transporter ATP-binding protein [Corynebacterium cystitidis]